MKEMKTLKLPGQEEAYEVVDSSARQQIQSKAEIAYVDEGLAEKVDKVDGKGLSTNDYTTSEKNKLSAIEDGATKTIVDTELKSSSVNPVQNKAVFAALAGKSDTGHNHTGLYTLVNLVRW